MLGRVTVPILPHTRVIGANRVLRDGVLSREQETIGVKSGAIVTIYNAMGDGSQAVSEAGVVDSRATTAYVYRDRAGSSILANPITLDDFGGPDDTSRAADYGVSLSFYGFPGIYHLKVTMPNGQSFGIPFVRVPWANESWFVNNISETYNDTAVTGAVQQNAIIINKEVGTDIIEDNNVARVIAQKSNVGVANTSMWQGEAPWSEPRENPFASASNDSPGASDASHFSVFARPMIIQASQYVDIANNVSATMKAGISMGFSAAAGSDIPANPTKPLLALYSEWATRTYVLYIAKGSGSGNTASQTLSNLSFTAADPGNGDGTGGMDRLQIRYNPNAKVVEGWVNGWFGGRITTAAAFPPGDGGNVQEGFNAFIITGATASANISSAWWNCRYWVGMPG